MNITISKEIFYDWAGANVWIFKQINALSGRNANYDKAMQVISEITDGKYVFPYYIAGLIGLALLTGLFGLMRKRTGNKFIFNHWVAVIILFVASFPINAAINSHLKDYFGYPRPYVAISSPDVKKLEDRNGEENNRSFPSGHVAFITCLVACLWSKMSETQRPLGALAIVLVGWSRIALGMHFPADVLASILITLLIVSITKMIVFGILTKMLRLKW